MGISKDTYARTSGGGTYNWYYDVETVGYKYHGNSIMAAVGLVALKYVDEDNDFRRQVCAWYDELLADERRIERVPMAPDCLPSRHLYQVLIADRDAVVGRLQAEKIFPGVHYRDNTVYSMYRDQAGRCPVADRASNRLLSLPLHLRLTREDVARVAACLKAAVSQPKDAASQ
jgi:dTDP-4-amino-4,6-dideoxygalactose transaminase